MSDVKFYAEGSATALGTEGSGATLTSGTTYYADLAPGGLIRALGSIHWSWDAAIVITAITIETTNYEPDDAVINAVAGAKWYPETAPPTVTVAGGTASSRMVHVGDNSAARMRAKIVVGGTGGVLRGRPHHKTL
jgi:hypothetical protein